MNINEMLQERGRVIAQARALVDKAASENREMTAEETSQYEAMNAEINRIRAAVDRHEALSRIEAEQAQASAPSLRPAVEGVSGTTDIRATKEYTDAFFAMLRNPNASISAVLDSTSGSGGTLVPTVLEAEIVKKLVNVNVMRSIAQIRVSSGNAIVPVQATLPTATWGTENVTYGETEPTFAPVDFSAFKLKALAKVSEELLYDSIADLQAELSDSIGNAMGIAEESAFVAGSGTGQPKGIILDAPTGVTTVAATPTAEEFIDTFHSLKRAYRANSSWLLSDKTVAALRKLKNTANFYWQPGLQAGQPDLLMGRPVHVSDAMPAPAAGAKIGVFGNFNYYRIQDRVGISLQRLNELYAEDGQVGFRVYRRTDGKCVLTEAFSAMVQGV